MLTSPKKGEAAVPCCDPALSVLVMLVSRNVYHVASALQCTAVRNFLADHISCRFYVGSVYRMRSLAVCHSDGKTSHGFVGRKFADVVR